VPYEAAMGGADALATTWRAGVRRSAPPIQVVPNLTLPFGHVPRGTPQLRARGLQFVGDGTRAASAARSCSIWVSTGLGGKLSLPRASRDL
jgi:hypothetical protein